VAEQSYGALNVVAKLKEIEDHFRKLDGQIAEANRDYPSGETGYGPRVQDLIHFEVVQNAFSIELQVPFPFKFIFASAGIRNSLNHQADTPAKKLAGLKLNHFAGFLKRSWRANDWLWGRLDGVEHVLRAIVDLDRIYELEPDAVTALARAAFAGSPAERHVLQRVWEETLAYYGIEAVGEGEAAFQSVMRTALKERQRNPPKAERYLAACRHALAAPVQLRILDKELVRVAETARDDIELGASPIANGAYWYGRVLENQSLDDARRVELFHDLRIGEETLEDESSSRLAFDVGSQGAAVAAALFAGDRGGLPSAARGALGSARGLTLASSRLIQLLARAPAVGAAVFFVLVGLTLWAATARSTLVGALLPALAILTVVLGVAALTLATSVYENSLAKFPRLLGFGVITGVPLAFALLFRWPKWWHYGADKLDSHVGKTGVTIAAALSLLAAAIAVTRFVVGAIIRTIEEFEPSYGRSWRRVVMGFYRWPVVGALLALASGFTLERVFDRMQAKHASWVGLAAERRGTILVLALLATLLLAALLEELVVPLFVWIRWRVIRPARAWVERKT
jgi:hypothetical protein